MARRRRPPLRKRLRSPGASVKRADRTPLTGKSAHPALARQRFAAGLSLVQVARRAGVTVVSVWRIEMGLQRPTEATLGKILRALKGTRNRKD